MRIITRDVLEPTRIRSAVLSIDALPSRLANTKRLPLIVGIFSAIEFTIVATSAYAASVLYHYVTLQGSPPAGGYALAALSIAALVSIVSVGFRHFVGMQRQPLHVILWNGTGAVVFAFSFFLSMIFLLKIAEVYSRGAFIFQVISVCAAVWTTRATFYRWLRSAVATGLVEARRVIFIGDNLNCSEVTAQLKNSAIRTVRLLPFPRDYDLKAAVGDNRAFAARPDVRTTIELCRTLLPDDIVILAEHADFSKALVLARRLSELPVNIDIAPVGAVNILSASRIVELDSVRALQVSRPPLSLFDLAIKRVFDIVVASIGLIVLSPLFLVVALAIKMDSEGAVFFRQMRHGYNNKTIHVFKFRSMTTVEDGEHKFTQATRSDSRVTRLGRILRQTNIDELPQLFNVLLGEMSIVGPRPHATAHNRMFQEQILPFSRRHSVKPGITGWAQVNGYRGETDTLEKMQRRVEHDLYYIDNWSFLLDMKIILMTMLSKNCYVNAY